MDAESKSLLKTAILKAGPLLQALSKNFQEEHLVWKRQENGWSGKWELRPDIGHISVVARNQLQEVASDFQHLFFKAHPEYAQGLVGFAGLISYNLSEDKAFLLQAALQELWQRHHRFDVDEAAVDAVVTDFSTFVDEPTVRLQFQAQLLNFRMQESQLSFPAGLTIRHLTEEEISNFYGGPIGRGWFYGDRSGKIHEFVIQGEYEQEKWFGSQLTPDRPKFDEIKALLDRAILALRTFKEGRVGYELVKQRCLSFCPIALPTFGSLEAQTVAGDYEIAQNGGEALVDHANRIFAMKEHSMETACRRLADAEIRNRSEDQIIDAVIGMEALLLAALGKDDRRSELKYRFSINYAALSEGALDRWRAFRIAKDLYDLRSTLAHGSELGQPPYRVGEENMSLLQAGARSRDALRTIIHRFLTVPERPVYKKPEFWERAYFGLSEEQRPL